MIEHKLIPDANLHEPKGVVSASTNQIYIADGSGSGTWRRVKESDIDYSVKADNQFGWNDISDSLYTSGSPKSISSGVRTQLTNNAAAAQTDTSRLGLIWNTASNQFTINDLNSTYIIRINCKIKAAAAAGTPYVVKFELESSLGPLVFSATDVTIKGGGYENAVSNTNIFYSGAAINNTPLKIYVTADTNITLYDVGFVVQRLYKET